MSGLTAWVGIESHWERSIHDEILSSLGSGAGNEDSGSDFASCERTDSVDAGGGDHRDIGSKHAAVIDSNSLFPGRRMVAALEEEITRNCCAAQVT